LWGNSFSTQALLFTAFGEYEGEDGVFSSYLLEGIELFEPVLTDYGSILGTDVDDDMAHLKRDEGCFRFPNPTGDRFYAPLPEFLPCLSSSASGPSWNFDTPKCSPGDQSMLIGFKWIGGPVASSRMNLEFSRFPRTSLLR
jgi:hypothetical protein